MEISVEKLQKVKLEEGEILIIHFDDDKMTEEDLMYAHMACKAVFTHNKVIFVPNHMDLSVIQNPDTIPIGKTDD
jgi:uncharacterized protein (DUF927 family)